MALGDHVKPGQGLSTLTASAARRQRQSTHVRASCSSRATQLHRPTLCRQSNFANAPHPIASHTWLPIDMRLLTTIAATALTGLAVEASQSARVFLFPSTPSSSVEQPRLPKEVARHILLQRVSQPLPQSPWSSLMLTCRRHPDPATAATCATSRTRSRPTLLSSTFRDMARAQHRSSPRPRRARRCSLW